VTHFIKNLFCLTFFSLLWLVGLEASEKADDVKAQIKHAKTLYELAKYHGGDSVFITKSLKYAKQAEELLKDSPELKARYAHTLELIRHDNETLLAYAEKRLVNYSPIMPMILNNFEHFFISEDPVEIALKQGMQEIVAGTTFTEHRSIFGTAVDVVIVSKEKSYEGMVSAYLNTNTPFYCLPWQELGEYITPKDIGQLYMGMNTTNVMKKISQASSKNTLGLIELETLDQVDGVCYFRVTMRVFDVKKGEFIKKFTSETFAREFPLVGYLVYGLIIFSLLFGIMVQWIFKKHVAHSLPWYHGVVTHLFSVLTIYLLLSSDKVTNFSQNYISHSPQGIAWLVFFSIIPFLTPLFLSYFTSLKVKNISHLIHSPQGMASLIFSVSLAYVIIYSSMHFMTGVIELPWLYLGFSLVTIAISSVVLGKLYSGFIYKKDARFLYLGVGLLCLFCLFLHAIFINHTRGVYLTSVFVSVIMLMALLLSKQFRKVRPLDAKPSTKGKSKIDELKEKLKEPEGYIMEPYRSLFEEVGSFILEDQDPKLEVIWVEADIGCGKTRMALEIAQFIQVNSEGQDSQKPVDVLFGDCDDVDDTTTLQPYEPFSQAFKNYLDEGDFESGADLADRASGSVLGKGFQFVGNAVSGPANLNTDMIKSDAEANKKMTLKEITGKLSKKLLELTKEKRIILVLDDTQWMDPETFELFKLFIDKLINDFENNEVSIILTTRRVPDQDKVKSYIQELKKEGRINLFEKINQEKLQSEELVSPLLEQLKIVPSSSSLIKEHLQGKGINRPLHILEFLSILVEKKFLISYGDDYKLIVGTDLNALPDPSDYTRMVNEEIADVDSETQNILQCCAIIGHDFDVSVIAHIFRMDLIELLERIKDSEKRGFVKDVENKDYIFMFSDKRYRGIFKNINRNFDLNKDVPQIVREYHKRYIEIIEGTVQDNIPTYEQLTRIVSHYLVIKETYPQKTLDYCLQLAESSLKRGLYSMASKYYDLAPDIMKILPKYNVRVDQSIRIGLLKSQLQRGDIDHAKSIIDEFEKDFEPKVEEKQGLVDYLLLKCEYLYKEGKSRADLKFAIPFYQEASQLCESLIKDGELTAGHELRAKFFHCLCMDKRDPDYYSKYLALIEEINDQINDFSGDELIGILEVKSELLNSIGFLEMLSKQEGYLDRAFKFYHEALEINLMPEINDLNGQGISYGGLGDVYSGRGEYEEAYNNYDKNYQISHDIGVEAGISRMSSMMGGLIINGKVEKKKELALKFYKESFYLALKNRNVFGVYFGLVGLHRVSKEETLNVRMKTMIQEWMDFISSLSDKSLPKDIIDNKKVPGIDDVIHDLDEEQSEQLNRLLTS
jgi:tetratricopeptide (TPR) repeat protein